MARLSWHCLRWNEVRLWLRVVAAYETKQGAFGAPPGGMKARVRWHWESFRAVLVWMAARRNVLPLKIVSGCRERAAWILTSGL
jgi:hypothetical protein